MHEIMKKVNELFNELVAKNAAVDNQTATLAKRAQEQEATATAQAEKETELVTREGAVSKIENVVQISEETKERQRDIAQENEKLSARIVTHRAQVEKDKSELIALDKNVRSAQDALNKGQAELKAGQKKLEEDRKNLKEQVIAEVAKNISSNLGKDKK